MDATEWIRDHVEPAGAIERLHERPWGTVWRVPIAGGVAWFKECPPAQAFEPPLTAALTSRWGDRVADVLAVDPERRWLLLGDAGQQLGLGGSAEPWLSILPRYAELQRGEVGRRREHLSAGVPDHGLSELPALYEDLLAHELPLAAGANTRLRAFAPRFAELCSELAAGGVPETIDHADLHGMNVYRRRGNWVVLDWGDSCVSHPFLTAYVTFLHLDELSHLSPDDPALARLRDSYLEPWGPSREFRPLFELALRLGPFAHVFKELRVFDLLPREGAPGFAANLAESLARCVRAADCS